MKLRSNKGESISEALVAILVVSLAAVMLSGAITTSASINNKIKESDVSFSAQGSSDDSIKIRVRAQRNIFEEERTAKLYETENGYYYYDEE